MSVFLERVNFWLAYSPLTKALLFLPGLGARVMPELRPERLTLT